MMSIGTLLAYSMVAACVLLLKYEKNDFTEIEPSLLEYSSGFRKILSHLFNLRNVKTPTQTSALIVTIGVTFYSEYLAIANHCGAK